MRVKDIYNASLDFLFGAVMYPNAITHSKQAMGRPKSEGRKGQLQNLLYDELQDTGFKHTRFQIIFPGQTSGVIYPLYDHPLGISEAHVRFYNNGDIHCELEVGRFDPEHYTGPRHDGKQFLEEILSEGNLPQATQEEILQQVVDKDYSKYCSRTADNPVYQQFKESVLPISALLAYRHILGKIVAGGAFALATPKEHNPFIFRGLAMLAITQASYEFIYLIKTEHRSSFLQAIRTESKKTD